MKLIQLLSATLLIICLSGCQSIPDELITKQNFLKLEFVEIDGIKTVDLEKSFCAEREYKYSKGFIGPISKFKNVPMVNCDNLTGNPPSQYTAVFNYLEDVREEILKNE